jgi:alcohol dehydrogenase (cytochrome c)/quinohemoprotein ethanol dehydrogenase
MRGLWRVLAMAGALAALAACGQPKQHNEGGGPAFSLGQTPTQPPRGPADVDGARILAADSEPGNWMTYGRTYTEQRYSPLNQITDQNAGQLGLTWSYDLDTHRGQEATPIVVDGVMYVSTAWSKVKALDAKTGALLWAYDPKVDGSWGPKACCDVVNRGVAVWKGKVFVGTLDGRLVALDAKTGNVVWSQQSTDSAAQTITGAPRVVKGLVLIGNSGAEFNVRGHVSAYDAQTGKLVWRFYTVPGDPSKRDHAASDEALKKIALKTWKGHWWTWGGGGTVWDSIVYDPELDLLYFGTDNGDPWNGKVRSPGGGDNLFVTSIVAVKPETGQYVWHYQLNPGDEWDYSATQQMILADLPINGQPRKVLMQAPKNGFFYVLDRTNGKLISAQPFATVTWAKSIDLKTGRPVMNPEALYSQTGKAWTGSPSPHGAHSWMPMSYDPKTGLVYIPVQEVGFTYKADPKFQHSPMGANLGLDLVSTSMPQDPKIKSQVMDGLSGYISAWDPIQQKEVWRAGLKGPWNGGVVSTAGDLIFEGNATGEFAAYRADNGTKVWSFDAQSPVMAGPVTYTVNGEQYVAVLSGWGGTYALLPGILSYKSGNLKNISRILVFKLGGTAKLPAVSTATPRVLNPPDDIGTPKQVDHGFRLFIKYCSACHGDAAVSGGATPDLRYSPLLASDSYYDVVLKGILKDQGMVSWAPVISHDDASDIRSYLIHRAHETIQQKAAGEPWTG